MGNTYHKHISAKHKLFDLKLDEVWRYKDLILLFVRRSFAVSYKQTILGPAWLFLNPLLTSVMHMIVFGNIAKLSTDGVPQLLFYLTGTAFWNFFNSSLSGNANTFTSNAGLFGKVYFPRLTVPIANVLTNVIKFAIAMILPVILMVIYCITGSVTPHWWCLLLVPVILLWIGLMAMGCGILVSGLTAKYRDLSVLVSFGMSLWMYGTPVVYPLSQLDNTLLGAFIKYNPVTAPIELFRYAVLGKGTILPESILVSVVFTVLVTFLGIIVFHKVERTFMDTV